VEQIVKNDFIDRPPSADKQINFSNPPKPEGQLGMPVIVDKLLGKTCCFNIVKMQF
jgi:hypothetical protein